MYGPTRGIGIAFGAIGAFWTEGHFGTEGLRGVFEHWCPDPWDGPVTESAVPESLPLPQTFAKIDDCTFYMIL